MWGLPNNTSAMQIAVPSTDTRLAIAGTGTTCTPDLQGVVAACIDPLVLQGHRHRAELSGNSAGSDSSSTQTSSIHSSRSSSRGGSLSQASCNNSSCGQPSAGSTATADIALHAASQRCSNDVSGRAGATEDNDAADASASNRKADSNSTDDSTIRLGSRSDHSWGSRSTTGSDSSGGSGGVGGSKSSSGIDVLSLDSLPAEDDLEDLLQRLQAGTAQLGGGMAVGSLDVLPFADTEQLVSPR